MNTIDRESATALAIPASLAELERLPIPGTAVDLDGTIFALNAAGARLLARPLEGILGRKVFDFAPGLEHLWMERLAAARVAPHRFEIAIATPVGARTVEYVVALRDFEGRPYLVAIATDIRELV